MNRICKSNVVLVFGAVLGLALFATPSQAQQRFYPNDGWIEYVDFGGGANIKLTQQDIIAGANLNALTIAIRVKAIHQQTLARGQVSQINTARLTYEIVKHCELYLWAGILPTAQRNYWRGVANPINAQWASIR